MKAFFSFLLVFSFVYLAGQKNVLEEKLSIHPAYALNDFKQDLKELGYSLSYRQTSLIEKPVLPKEKQAAVEELLSVFFDLKAFEVRLRPNKLLIINRQTGKTNVISGFVEDVNSKERLIGANVFFPQFGIGTSSNTYGFFSIPLPAQNTDPVEIKVSYLGYEDTVFSIPSINKLQTFYLTESNTLLDEAVVSGAKNRHLSGNLGNLELSPNEINNMPVFFGEQDLVKSVQMLPGVQGTSEGNIGLVVRGGSPDQNLILLDGVPVYNISHLFGYFSVFNTDAIKNVSLTKGGFPARYGGRLSSIVEVNMKEGNMEQFHGTGSIGLLSSKLTLEGPLIKNKTSFMISGRRTYFDLLAQPFLNDESRGGAYFYDVALKVNHKFSAKERIYLSMYLGRDNIYYDRTSGEENAKGAFGYGNVTGVIRYNYIFNTRLFSNTSLAYTRYKLDIALEDQDPFEYTATRYFSDITDYRFRHELEYTYSSRHHIKTGVLYSFHQFRPGAFIYEEEDANNRLDSLLQLSPYTNTHDVSLYIEDEWKLNQKWRLNSGLHYATYFVNGAFYNSLQPRLIARYLFKPDWSFQGSYSYMMQAVHLLTSSGSNLPTDLWVSSNENIAPQRAHQWNLGSTKDLYKGALEFTAEAYYKYFSDLITFREGTLFRTSLNWENQVATGGTGNAWGLELFLRKKTGKTTGWIGYTLAWSQRRFREVNDGLTFPYKYDRRHELKLSAIHTFSKRFFMSVNFILNSGIRATVPIASYRDVNGNQEVLWSRRNAYTYPTYNRADIGFNWVKKTRWGSRTWNISLYNAYNRLNPYFIFFATEDGRRVANKISVFPVLPSVSYLFRF